MKFPRTADYIAYMTCGSHCEESDGYWLSNHKANGKVKKVKLLMYFN